MRSVKYNHGAQDLVTVPEDVTEDGRQLTRIIVAAKSIGLNSETEFLERLSYTSVKEIYKSELDRNLYMCCSDLKDEDMKFLIKSIFREWIKTTTLVKIADYARTIGMDYFVLKERLWWTKIPTVYYWGERYAEVADLDFAFSPEGEIRYQQGLPSFLKPDAWLSLSDFAWQNSVDIGVIKRAVVKYGDIFLLEKTGSGRRVRYRREDLVRLYDHLKAKKEQKKKNRQYKEEAARKRRKERAAEMLYRSRLKMIKEMPDTYHFVDGVFRVKDRQG